MKLWLVYPARVSDELAHRKVALVVSSLLFVTSACGSAAKDLGFRYDAARDACFNDAGESGRNQGLMECGLLENDSEGYRKAALAGRNLRGVKLNNVFLTHANLRNADLRGATFTKSNLSDANLSGADLRDAQLDLHPDDFPLDPATQMSNLKINGNTLVRSQPSFNLLKAVAEYGADFDQGATDPAAYPNPPLFEELVTSAERELMLHDLAAAAGYSFEAPEGSAFAKLFEGRDASVVRAYLEGRIRHVLPSTTKNSSWGASNASRGYFYPALHSMLDDPLVESDDLLNGLETGGRGARRTIRDRRKFRFNGQTRTVLSTRVGIVSLGPAYTSSLTIGRVATLIHEARHSDCHVDATFEEELKKTLGQISELRATAQKHVEKRDRDRDFDREAAKAQREEMRALREKAKELEARATDAMTCGHRHVDCSADHVNEYLRGREGACDDQAWGAYAAGAIYSKMISGSCASCTEKERQVSLMEAADSLSRITVKDGEPDPESWPAPVQDMLTDEDLAPLQP